MAYAEINEDNQIEITTEWNDKELIKLVPGVRRHLVKPVWYMPLSWAQCITIRNLFKDRITFGPKLIEWGWKEKQNRVEPVNSIRTLLAFTENEPDFLDSNSGKDLYDYQKVGAEFLLKAGDALLADEMGTGKTVQALAALNKLEDNSPVLIICPNSVKSSWREHIEEWTELTVCVIDGSADKRRKLFKESKYDIYIINFESVRLHSRLAPYGSIRLKKCILCDPKSGNPELKINQCEVHSKELNGIPFKTVIVDEAHRIKDPKSLQTRATWAVMHGKSVQRRWALTGTPIAKHPGDLWSIMHGVAPYDYPVKSKFVDRYCIAAWNAYGTLDIVGLNPEHKDEFYKFFDPRFRRILKSLVLKQLPPKIYQRRNVQLSPKQLKAYRDIESQYITMLDDGGILVAPGNLAAQKRLIQFASAYVEVETVIVPLTVHAKCKCYAEGLDEHKEECSERIKIIAKLRDPSPKLDELELILDEVKTKQLAVCAESRQLIDMAAARLDTNKISHKLIVGGMSQWDRDLSLKQFQNGDVQVLLFTDQAGGVGLTMTATDMLIRLQRSWSMIYNKQVEDRVHRIGSEKHEAINIIDIVAEGTIEEVQITRLYDKLKRLEEITRDRDLLLANGMSAEDLDMEEMKILQSNLGMP